MTQPVEPQQPAAVDAADTDAPSSESEESRSPRLWDRLFGRRTSEQKPDDSDQKTDEQPGTPAPSKSLTLSEDELERRVQAETDRREAKRKKDEIARQEQERRQAIERKLDPASPDFDPYGGAEERAALQAAEKSNEQFVGLLHQVGQQHDNATLDVIVAALPQKEQDRILKLEGAGVGLEGRKLIVSEGLKALERHWRAEGQRAAEARLREDPIFRKRVFTEHRDEVDEPELLPANGAVSNSGDFMQMLQRDYKGLKSR